MPSSWTGAAGSAPDGATSASCSTGKPRQYTAVVSISSAPARRMNACASRRVISSQSHVASTPGGSGWPSVVRRRLGATPRAMFSMLASRVVNSTPAAIFVGMRALHAARSRRSAGSSVWAISASS